MTLTGAAAVARGGQEVDEDEKQETDRHMVAMWKVVKKHRPSVPLLELVLNPHDDPCIGFGQTVENMFGLSFLVSLLSVAAACMPECCKVHHDSVQSSEMPCPQFMC